MLLGRVALSFISLDVILVWYKRLRVKYKASFVRLNFFSLLNYLSDVRSNYIVIFIANKSLQQETYDIILIK